MSAAFGGFENVLQTVGWGWIEGFSVADNAVQADLAFPSQQVFFLESTLSSVIFILVLLSYCRTGRLGCVDIII